MSLVVKCENSVLLYQMMTSLGIDLGPESVGTTGVALSDGISALSGLRRKDNLRRMARSRSSLDEFCAAILC